MSNQSKTAGQYHDNDERLKKRMLNKRISITSTFPKYLTENGLMEGSPDWGTLARTTVIRVLDVYHIDFCWWGLVKNKK